MEPSTSKAAIPELTIEKENGQIEGHLQKGRINDNEANTTETSPEENNFHNVALASNDEQSDASVNSNSQFYESSDSKIDYAVKNDDNDTLSDIDDIKTDSAMGDSEDSALGSLPPDVLLNDREEEIQEPSDGSDSGLGSEITEEVKIPNFYLDLSSTSSIENNDCSPLMIVPTSTCNDISISNESAQKTPRRSSLKRKIEENDENKSQFKKKKQRIQFDNVTVYYFPRAQGFTCVPSQGGSTLGMEWEHSHSQNFTLMEHALEQRRLHRQIIMQLKNERNTLQTATISSSEESDTEEEASDISESELDLDSYYFLQPVPTRQRRALLRAAGVRKIEGYEKDECRDIRTSREFCGCACKGSCDPNTCSCSIAGIKCQVDRLNFPCGCTRDCCKNTTGRIEFNPVRVRTHFIHTLMRLGLERKNEEAAKRQWTEVRKPCISSYESERCLGQDDGLLRDVNLTPRVEVESCVNSGSFSNVHCEMSNNANQSNTHENVYMYNAETSHGNMTDNVSHLEETRSINSHIDPYTSSILQSKPTYATNNLVNFNQSQSNTQHFPCDLNYTYGLHQENHQFKGIQSFSASSFEEFAHSSQMSMFNHYGHMYVPEYLPKSNPNITDHSALNYQTMSTSPYNSTYKNMSDIANENKDGESHYTTLMSLPYPRSTKLETVDSDENWFSHNTLLNLDHGDQTTQDGADLQPQMLTTPADSTISDTTENFGELIKKTMVESVTV